VDEARDGAYCGIEFDLPPDITSALALLPSPEFEVIVLRFGFDRRASGPLTLEEVGSVMGLSRAEVREIETSALGRLKPPPSTGG
jgi:DNA-directed RNA polymerase sigma subunit (sigma70/sigma32)